MEILKKINTHLSIDADPWLKYGNTPQDTTTQKQREWAMAQTIKGRMGLKKLGYSKKEIKQLNNND